MGIADTAGGLPLGPAKGLTERFRTHISPAHEMALVPDQRPVQQHTPAAANPPLSDRHSRCLSGGRNPGSSAHEPSAGLAEPPRPDGRDQDSAALQVFGTRSWSFLCVIAPVRLPAETGSPVISFAVF
jgi:hypothetical protein